MYVWVYVLGDLECSLLAKDYSRLYKIPKPKPNKILVLCPCMYDIVGIIFSSNSL